MTEPTATTCPCGTPTRDNAALCDKCCDTLGYALVDVPFVHQELETTLTRQRAAAMTGGPPSAETTLPFHTKASEVASNLHALLVSWVRFCIEENVHTQDLPEDNLPALAQWLLAALPALRLRDIAAEAHDEITDAVADARRLVFWKRKTRVYLGTCELPVIDEDSSEAIVDKCPGEVYADEGDAVGWCDECEQGHTVVIRRADLERRLDDGLYTAAEIARLTTYLGLHAGRDAVRKRIHYWHRHKRVLPTGTDDKGDPMFRYREVRVLLAREYADAPVERSA